MNHSDFSNQLTSFAENPTEVFQAKLHTCTPLKPEIGKENIRFPAFPSFAGKTIRKTKPGNVVFGLRREESAIAECPITGIVLTIGIPSLSFPLTYENPIAKARNAFKIAALPASELSNIPSDILAGTILSLLSHAKLIEDHKTGLERNEALCTAYSSASLAGILGRISTILNAVAKPERMKRFVEESPLVSFNEGGEIEVIVKTWGNIAFPTEGVGTPLSTSETSNKKESVTQAKPGIQVKKPKGNISLTLRSKLKSLSAKLGNDEIISQKASSIFQFLGTGQNWKALTKENKKSYLSYLTTRFVENEKEEYDDDLETLISLLKEIPVDDAYNALTEEDDSVSSQADKNAGREERTMTIKERLAAIAAKTKGKGE